MKILIVDDEERIIKTMIEALEPAGYELFYTTSPLKALEMISSLKIDTVISDIRMSEMDGLELLKKIKQNYYHIRVIIITAYQDMDSIKDAMNYFASAYLTKPIQFTELIAKLSQIDKEINKEDLKQNEIKTEFLNHMNHELRTPLTAIIGAVELMKNAFLNDYQKELLGIIEEGGEKLFRRIKDLLYFTEIKNMDTSFFKMKTTYLDPLLNNIIKKFQKECLKKKIVFDVKIEEDLKSCLECYEDELSNILFQLIDNAVKFSSKGSIKITAEKKFLYHKKGILFKIHDNGIGIRQDEYDRIFDFFSKSIFSSIKNFGGLGLGLAIVKELLKKIGGEIEVESIPGQGTTFQFFFPAEKVEPKPEIEKTESDKKLKVLVVEDNAINQEIFVKLLSYKKWNSEIAENGKIGIDKFLENRYDLILMDIQMPVMDGFEAARTIRGIEKEKGGHVPIIAVTAFHMKGYDVLCKMEGMDDYMTKPVRMEELYQKIEKLCV